MVDALVYLLSAVTVVAPLVLIVYRYAVSLVDVPLRLVAAVNGGLFLAVIRGVEPAVLVQVALVVPMCWWGLREKRRRGGPDRRSA